MQFTSDMLPSDVLGISIYSAIEQKFEFKRGPVFTNVLLADEINRTTPKTQSALLEAMNEGQVTVDAHSYPLPQPFLVIATQNPVEHHGTYPSARVATGPLPDAACGWAIPTATPSAKFCAPKPGTAQLELMQPVLTAPMCSKCSRRLPRFEWMIRWSATRSPLCAQTRESEQFSLGVSPRGSQMLYRAAQAMAFLDGRNFCVPEDFKPLAVPVFAHRVVVNGRYSSTLKKSEQAEQVMQEIVESVPVPV